MIGQLFINGNERLQVDTRELTSGDTLEVLIVDGRDDKAKWVETTVEHNGYSYFLTGLLGYSPVGLFAKVI